MSTPVRVAAFAGSLAVAFLGAFGVGAAVGPLDVEPTGDAMAGHDAGSAAMAGTEHSAGAADHQPGGLSVSSDGYTLRVVSQPRAGTGRPLRFVVEGPDGEPVTAYDEEHERRLHLVTIRRDGTGFQHVHPTLAADGTWTARLTLAPGSNRLIADLTPTSGPELVLGTDVEVAGDYDPVPPAPVTSTARSDGYRIELQGELVPSESSPVTARITRGGEPVTDLQTYLGAFGHLIALREGDLGYLHVHPGESGAGPEIPFVAEVPSDGRYRLFLEFRHHGTVHTAGFTMRAQEDGHDH